MSLKSFLFFTILISFFTNSQADFFRTSGKQILDTDGNPIILRGVGLGGWLVPEGYMLRTPGFGSPTSIRNQFIGLIGVEKTDEMFEIYRANYVNATDIRAIAEMGYNSIRLPFHYQLFYDTESQTFDESGFQLLDTFLDWCKAENLYVILDMHCAPGGQSKDNIADGDGVEARLWTNSANQDLTVAIWQEIARRYVNEETIIGYDLLNEPVLAPGYTNVALRSLYVRIISAIRTLDKNHMVFIEGNWYATDFSSLTPPMDTNLVYSFHKYWSETTKSTIQQYINIRNEFNVPLWLGESGENSNPWFYETIKLMEENEIGWNWWTHKKISTTTSPYSSPISDNYQRVLDYLGGYGDRPSEEFSQKALFEMAENLALEKCIYLPDVVAAIFSQDFNFQSQPYKPHPIPGMIAAVDYDKGNQSVAYYDTDYKRTRWDAWEPWNTGGAYRNDGVDIGEIAAEKGGGFYVGWIENGEWLQYTIDVAVDGVYDLVFAVASAGDAGKIRAKMDGVASGTDLSVPNTSDWQNWTQIRLPGIALTKGTHHFRIEFIGGGFNLSQIAFNLRSAENLDEIGKEGFMGQNFPNPFNNKTSIPVVLNSRTNVRAEVYNTRGQLVRTLFDADHDAGLLTLSWDGENNTGLPVTSGSYFYMLRIGESKKSKKMLYLK